MSWTQPGRGGGSTGWTGFQLAPGRVRLVPGQVPQLRHPDEVDLRGDCCRSRRRRV